ncbi:MAG: aldehyde dehydrogenase family protein [Candidatus Nanopelagicaceae bacterium]|nr:aldehyde dehydrogenase family protein [Candidatus Nanopelagicaceae bacterium]
MATKPRLARKKSPATFESINPATGEVVGVFPVFTKSEVEDVVARAKVAAERWANLSFRARNVVLRDWASTLTRDMKDVAELIHRETGKPLSDATLEVALAIEHIGWAGKFAPRVLGRQSRPAGLLMFNMAAQVQRVPFGVVGVIGPWNYPIFTPVGSIAYALAAGNAVVFKPSEYTPAIGAFLEESWKRIAPFKDIFITITGDATTGAALTESKVDKISFTGSTKTAKKVAAACAVNMTPVVLECGGKDAVLVDKDADISKAAEMTLWHAMSNAGQSCIGAERVYVHRQVADKFKKEIVDLAKEIKPGFGDGAKYGPATMPSQLKVIKSHIDDAASKGGTFLLGGKDAIKGGYVDPVILADVPEDSLAVTEETFGPTLVINTVSNMDEAVDLANSTSYGLGAAVWSKKNGKRIASLLKCGMVSINSAFSFAAIGAVPFGGVKDSGYGRIHGAEGLLEFTYPRTVVKRRFRIPLEFTTFERSERADRILIRLVKLLHKRRIR